MELAERPSAQGEIVDVLQGSRLRLVGVGGVDIWLARQGVVMLSPLVRASDPAVRSLADDLDARLQRLVPG